MKNICPPPLSPLNLISFLAKNESRIYLGKVSSIDGQIKEVQNYSFSPKISLTLKYKINPCKFVSENIKLY